MHGLEWAHSTPSLHTYTVTVNGNKLLSTSQSLFQVKKTLQVLTTQRTNESLPWEGLSSYW